MTKNQVSFKTPLDIW